ncbi:MAG: endonuclease, partial [Prevotella sp.]|nr:endonuclease [Prevotella sp.]
MNYSKSLNGLKKESLKTAVYKLLNKNVSMLAYGSGKDKTWWGFYYTDRNTKTNECINRYSAKKFYFGSYNTGEAISGMNIEHSFPKSWWGGSNNNAYKDLFNLYPSDSQANSSKSNYPMGLVTNVSSEEPGYDKVGTGTIDGVPGTRCWEPGDQYKGDFSRAYMYMATTYQNLTWQGKEGLQQLETGAWPTLKTWAYTLYLKWIKDDPVDELEINRNNAVYAKQGNRNLFVDYPYLAEYIWGDSIDVPFNPSTSITTAVDDERYIQHGVDFIAQPKFSPEGGTYYEEQLVSITCATPGVTILYTTDGSNPIVNGVTYASPISVKESTTIKAVAVKDGNTSEVATAAYVIEEVSTDFAETFDLCDGTGGNDGLFSGSVASGAFKPDNE